MCHDFSPRTNSQKSGTHESEVFQSNETTVCLSEILNIIKLLFIKSQ